MIQFTKNEEIKRLFGDKKLYGTVLQDNIFRIIDKSKETTKTTKNRQGRVKGRECVDLRFQELTDILYRLKLTPEAIGIQTKQYPKDKNKLIDYLIKEKEYKTENMSIEQLLEAAKWASTGLIKDGLCEIIQEYFIQESLLYKLIQ